MSQDNVEIVRRAFDAFERNDLPGMFGLVADDVVTIRPDIDRVAYEGKAGFLQATAEWTEGFQEWSVEPQHYLDAGDHVVVTVRQAARGAESGVPVESDFWFVFRLRDGKIAQVSFHSRRDEAFELAGLSE